MEKNLYIDATHPNEIRVVLKSENHIEEYEYENKNKLHVKNNIYLGKVSRIEPSLQAAFVNYGKERHGFLAFNDIQSDYFQIPHDDKENIKKKEEAIREELKEESTNLENNEENVKRTDNEQSIEENNSINTEINNVQENSNDTNQKKFEFFKKKFGVKRYKIQEVIKPGQIMLVQVLKDERGQKGAALTTFISLAGKYTVLMPNTPKGGGISKKIFDRESRKKIREILNTINIPNSMGLIVRTAGSNKTRNEIDSDVKYTLKLWDEVKSKAVSSIAPSLIYEEGNLIKRALRDIYDNETKNIFIDGNDGYQEAKNLMKIFMPQNAKFIKKYRGKIPLFHSVGIEEKLNIVFEPTVKLKSGGYIVINPTEALIAIDINSGKSTKEVNVERTALNTNLEAVDEIARQIKIRDLAGLIIIDFIDMLNFHNRRTVERKLKERLKNDRARIQIGRISNFGLLEMSRQRLRESSIIWNMVLSLDSFSNKILKLLEEKAIENKSKIVNIKLPEKVANNIKENYSEHTTFMKKKLKINVNFSPIGNMIIPEYSIEFLNKNKKVVKKVEYIENKNSVKLTKPYKNFNFFKKRKKNPNKFRNKFSKKKIKKFSPSEAEII